MLAAILLAALIPGLVSGSLLIASCEAAALGAQAPAHPSAAQERREAAPKLLCRVAALPALPVVPDVALRAVARHVRRRPETVKFRSASPRRRKHRPKRCRSPHYEAPHP